MNIDTFLTFEPSGLFKFLTLTLGLLLVFTQMFSSWLLVSRLTFALLFACSAFIAVLPNPAVVFMHPSVVTFLDLLYISCTFGIAAIYVYDEYYDKQNETETPVSSSTTLIH
jgi:hypothetical protein